MKNFVTDFSIASTPYITAVAKSRMEHSEIFDKNLVQKILEYTLFNEIEHTLLRAAMNGSLDIVQYLFQWSPSEWHRDAEEALRIAASFDHINIVRFMVEKCHVGNNRAALIWAARKGRVRIVKYFTVRGIVDARTLQMAAASGCVDTVQYVLSNVGVVTDDENCAFETACALGNIHVVRLFVERGAFISDVVIQMALYFNRTQVVEYLRASR